jgi:hypothetical protein
LRKSCALALANIQSSDEDVAQEFKFLAGQIQVKEKTEETSAIAAKVEAPEAINPITVLPKPDNASSTVPASVSSDQSTVDRIDSSTPQTCPGLTRAETLKSSSGPKTPLFGPNRGSASSQGSKTVESNSSERAITWMNNYLEKRTSKPDSQRSVSTAEATRKSSQRASVQRSRSHRRKHDSRDSLLHMDLNKRLPSVPGQQLEPERAKHFTRLIKTIGKKRASSATVKGQQSSELRNPSIGQKNPAQALTPNVLQPQESTSQQDIAMTSIAEADLQTQSFDSRPRKRMPFSYKFIGRFEWKRQRMPPIIQAA